MSDSKGFTFDFGKSDLPPAPPPPATAAEAAGLPPPAPVPAEEVDKLSDGLSHLTTGGSKSSADDKAGTVADGGARGNAGEGTAEGGSEEPAEAGNGSGDGDGDGEDDGNESSSSSDVQDMPCQMARRVEYLESKHELKQAIVEDYKKERAELEKRFRGRFEDLWKIRKEVINGDRDIEIDENHVKKGGVITDEEKVSERDPSFGPLLRLLPRASFLPATALTAVATAFAPARRQHLGGPHSWHPSVLGLLRFPAPDSCRYSL